jgi:hypothetical protein
MFRFLCPNPPVELLTSKLLDEKSCYASFERDLKACRQEVLIESPFITTRRLGYLMPVFKRLRSRGVQIVMNTRSPEEQASEFMMEESRRAVSNLQDLGALVLYTGRHHRKLAILDRRILYEGSLNILSQNDSCEVMRRIESERLAEQMMRFVKLDKFVH